MADDSNPSSGSLSSAKRLLATGVAAVQTRLELFLVEIEEEKHRLVELFVWILIAVSLGLITLLLATFTIIYLFWERAPLTVLIVLGVVYAAATLLAYKTVQARIRSRSAFSATLDEIKKDRACLETKN